MGCGTIPKSCRWHQEYGFGLLEIFLSLMLSSFILVGLISYFYSLNQSLTLVLATTRVDQNAMAALTMLRRDIHMAGRVGCSDAVDFKKLPHFLMRNSISVWAEESKGISDDFGINNVKPQTDVLLILRQDDEEVTLQQKSVANHLKINAIAGLVSGDWISISDCVHQEVVKIESISQYKGIQNIRTLSTNNNAWPKHALVSLVHGYLYYIAATQRNNNQRKSIYALYRKDILNPHTHAMEIGPGIDAFKIDRDHETVTVKLINDSIDSAFSQDKVYRFQQPLFSITDARLFVPWVMSVTIRG